MAQGHCEIKSPQFCFC